ILWYFGISECGPDGIIKNSRPQQVIKQGKK
ncbi:unnamed protein product, partial [Allacma fusca]